MMRVWVHLLLLTLLGCESPSASLPASDPPPLIEESDTFSILAWNVESGGSDPEVIGTQLTELSGYDVIALSEVSRSSFDVFQDACGASSESIESATGGGDRLQIIYDGVRFELVRQLELDEYRGQILNNGTHRSPLVAHLRERQSGVEFQVMVNHLARRDEELRSQQATTLREWARDQTLPTITIGDFNFDYDFPTERGNGAFVEMLRDNVWQWVEPEELVDTNWSDSDGDGRDNYPNSMLDFAFVAGPAKEWEPACRVIVREDDFPDDETTSDHRPIELIVTPSLD